GSGEVMKRVIVVLLALAAVGGCGEPLKKGADGAPRAESEHPSGDPAHNSGHSPREIRDRTTPAVPRAAIVPPAAISRDIEAGALIKDYRLSESNREARARAASPYRPMHPGRPHGHPAGRARYQPSGP